MNSDPLSLWICSGAPWTSINSVIMRRTLRALIRRSLIDAQAFLSILVDDIEHA